MPWTCPVCHTQIHHSPLDYRPRSGASYRCHICHLDLVYDADDKQLVRPGGERNDMKRDAAGTP